MDAEQSHTVPHISFDYVFLGQEDEKALPIILIRDHGKRVTFSYAVPNKGTASPYPAGQVAYRISQLGRSKIVFRSDNEPAPLACLLYTSDAADE